MSLPEEIIFQTLTASGISVFSEIDEIASKDRWAIMLRTTYDREERDVNMSIPERIYNFQIQCFSRISKLDVLNFVDIVEESLSDIEFRNDVEKLILAGGTSLPTWDGAHGYSLSIAITK